MGGCGGSDPELKAEEHTADICMQAACQLYSSLGSHVIVM